MKKAKRQTMLGALTLAVGCILLLSGCATTNKTQCHELNNAVRMQISEIANRENDDEIDTMLGVLTGYTEAATIFKCDCTD